MCKDSMPICRSTYCNTKDNILGYIEALLGDYYARLCYLDMLIGHDAFKIYNSSSNPCQNGPVTIPRQSLVSVTEVLITR